VTFAKRVLKIIAVIVAATAARITADIKIPCFFILTFFLVFNCAIILNDETQILVAFNNMPFNCILCIWLYQNTYTQQNSNPQMAFWTLVLAL